MRSSIRNLLLLLSLLLTACGSSGGLTPEIAVLRKLTVARGIDPFSIRILQSQAYQKHVLILISYTGTSLKGKRMGCGSFYDTYRDDKSTWMVGSQGMSCESIGPFGVWSIGTGGGVSHLAEPGGGALYSYIYGQMDNEDIVTVTITWEDGQTQTTPVRQGTYLVIRDGQHSYLNVEGKDASGSTVYTQRFSP
jgi:hypothetical protein